MDRNKIKMNKNLLIVLAFLLFNIGYGQTVKTWTGNISTAWNNKDNWSPVGVPIASENVIITNAANQPVISTAGTACATLELLNSTPASVVVLTVKAGSFFPASITMISNGGDTSDCSLNIEEGRVSVTGNVTMNGTPLQNEVTFSGMGNLSIAGIMTGGILNTNTKGTITYNGSGTRTVGAYTYNNLTLSGSGIRTINTSDVIVNGVLTMASSVKASAAPTYGPNAALQYNSTTPLTTGPEWVTPFIAKGGVEISNPSLNPGESVVTIDSGLEKRFNDGVPLIIDEEASLVSSGDMYFGGDFINNRGSLKTDGYVYLTGAVNQSIDSFTSAGGVTMIKNAGIAIFTGNIITKNLIINGLGTLHLGTGLTHSFSDWTRTQGTLNAGSSIFKISGNVIGNGGNFNAGDSTVEFNGGVQNLGTGSIIYNNLVLSGTGIKTFGAKTTINETFSIMAGAVANLTANLVHTAKYIKLGDTAQSGGSWGSKDSNAVNKNDTYFTLNNGIVNVGPTIVISTNNIAALSSVYGTPSTSKPFTISGTAMLGALLITPPAGFEVSTDGITFSDTLTLGSSAYIASTTVYVRLKGTINAANYSGDIVLTSAGTSNVNITIATSTVSKAPLAIAAKDISKVYGSDNPVFTATYDKFVNGDTEANLITLPTITTLAVKGSAVGKYAITTSGAVSSNYAFTYATNASLTITPAALTITAKDNSKVYASDNPVLTAGYVGFVNGDTEASLTTQAKITTTATKASAVGNYPIAASGAVSSNYTITYGTNASLTITPAALTITAKDNSKVYGSDNPILTASYVGFVNGDTEASLTTQAKIATTATKASAVGNYPITVSGAVSSNYTITYGTNTSLTITPATLTITAKDNSKVYGSDNPILTAIYTGFVNGDTASDLTTQTTISTTAVTGSSVGDYPITVSGAAASNYTITYGTNGSLTITPAALTITANNNSRAYGTENPILTISYSGFVNGDSEVSLTTPAKIETTATTESAVGDYPITASGAVSANYAITYSSGTLKVIASSNAGLTDLAISEGTLSPAFAEGTTDYTTTVPNDIKAITVTPTTADATATVTVNGVEVPSGTISGEIPLQVGENTITTVVTAQDGTVNNYTVVVTREPSNNAGLIDLTTSEGVLSPVFAEGTKDYTTTVPNDIKTITVTPVTADATATVTINGKVVPSGIASEEIPLQVGKNEITTVVTAQDGTINTYSVIVTREPSHNSGLTDLAISEGTISPTFAEETKEYTTTVPNDITTIKVTPTVADAEAKVTVNGVEVPSGNISGEISLKVGENEITTVVTAQDGTTSTYTVIVTREPSHNSGLIDLATNEGTLSPAFAEGTKDYTTTVPNDVKTITLTPVTADATATVMIDGKIVPSGIASGEIPLKVGKNEITTVVTAQDGTTSTYTVIVTREASHNTDLSDIIVSEGALSPAFNVNNNDYKVVVPNDIPSIIITPKTIDPDATVEMKVDGITITDNTAPIDLKVGDNEVTIVVTAPDETQETYTVIVTREPSENAGLTDLAISEGTLSPAFAEGTKDYTATVPNDVTTIKVTPTTADTTATVTVNGVTVPAGTASGEIPLKVGENEIVTIITAQDGTTINTYTVIVTREPSNEAGLSDITLSDGTLSPAFNTDTKDYRVDVPNETNSIVITPITIDPTATVEMKIDGVTITDPTAPIDLKVGDNVITVIVTAEDGTQETYTVIVDRADAVPPVIVPSNIITPNGDGKNDYWIVDGLDSYPNNSVKVFDRAARLVYSKDNYNNDWDGTFKGSPVNEDTYYYLIDLGNGSPKLKGFISILRN